MRDLHRGLQSHDARGALERVGGAHELGQVFGRCRFLFELEQPARENGDLVFGFDAEQFPHREIRQILGRVRAHARLRFRDEKTRSASSRPTTRPCQGSRPRV